MKKFVTAAIISGVLVVATAVPTFANPSAPTNGGSANGNGSSGQCTGAEADRPPSCHNNLGSGN